MVINTPAAPITASFISQAHAAGLPVHGWTFSTADPALAALEFRQYLDMGMDGVFANYPDLAVAAVPEPSISALLALGGVGLLALRRRLAAVASNC